MSRAGLPYSILPTQNVAAAGTGTSAASTAAAAAAANSAAAAAMGTYGASSGRVSPQRTQSVDLQFSQVVSQKQNIQKDMDALQLELDSKSRENADLHSKVRSLEDERVRLTREKQQLNLDRDEEARRLHGESERGRNQLSDMLKQLRQQVSTLESDKKSKALLHAQELQELQEANKRLDSLAAASKNQANMEKNDMALKLDAQETFVAECRKEIALKDEQVKKAKKEVARMTTTLEKVAKELVSRNKERDADILRRQQQYELDARRAGDELASLVQEKRDLTKNELQQKEELLLLKAQWDKAQTHAAELAQEIAGLNVRLEAKDEAERICMREAADAVEQLELLKNENNDLHAMNDRLNEQLAAAQEAAARAEERADRLHDDAVDTDDGMAALQRERAAYASKVVRMGEAAGAETERLVEEVDRFRLLVREAAIQHAPTEARDVEMELLREQGREAEQQQQQRKRALAPVQHGDEHAALALLQRLRDDLVMAWEDLRVVKSDVVDEIQRFNDLNAQHLALKEAYVVDREHLATLTTNLNEANAAYAKVTKERSILQDSLKEHDERMQEWVALSNDRDEHQAQLIRDNKGLKEDLDRTRQQTGASLQEKLELERLVHTVREENERLARLEYDARAQRNDYEGLVVSLREEVKVLQKRSGGGGGGGGGGEEGGESGGGGGEASVLLREAETEKAVLEARVKELQARVEDAKKKDENMEREMKTLRDQNFELRHSQDDLRANVRALSADVSQSGVDTSVVSAQLESQRGVAELLRRSRDEADSKIVRLEGEKQQLAGEVSELKRETQALWTSMRDASAENDQYREAFSQAAASASAVGVSPAPSFRNSYAPGGGGGFLSGVTASPGAGVTPAHRGLSSSSARPQDSVLAEQDAALRMIEDRVTNLLSKRNNELSSWVR